LLWLLEVLLLLLLVGRLPLLCQLLLLLLPCQRLSFHSAAAHVASTAAADEVHNLGCLHLLRVARLLLVLLLLPLRQLLQLALLLLACLLG
jgi:hypothetical protein